MHSFLKIGQPTTVCPRSMTDQSQKSKTSPWMTRWVGRAGGIQNVETGGYGMQREWSQGNTPVVRLCQGYEKAQRLGHTVVRVKASQRVCRTVGRLSPRIHVHVRVHVRITNQWEVRISSLREA
jgi:hypothetical protein